MGDFLTFLTKMDTFETYFFIGGTVGNFLNFLTKMHTLETYFFNSSTVGNFLHFLAKMDTLETYLFLKLYKFTIIAGLSISFLSMI